MENKSTTIEALGKHGEVREVLATSSYQSTSVGADSCHLQGDLLT